MKARSRRMLASSPVALLLLVASSGVASAAATYVGTSSEGESVEFQVERRDVLTLTRYDISTTQICDDGSTMHGHRTVAAWSDVKEGVALNGRDLGLREDDGTDEAFINGKVGPRRASGELEIKFKNGSVSCRSGQVFWTAERVRAIATGGIYRGTTSQGGSIKLRIELQERALVLTSYRIPTTQACEDGTSYPLDISAGVEGFVFAGHLLHMFDGYGDFDVRADGRFRARTASGTLEVKSFPELDGGSELACTSGELTWTAERTLAGRATN